MAGERSGLFTEIIRLTEEIGPRFVFLENVPAIRKRGLDTIIKIFTTIGYDCRWTMLRASQVGAPHRRQRWFLLAYSKSERLQKGRFSLREEKKQPMFEHEIKYEIWDKEPKDKFELVRMANGLQDRSHRIKALGNAVVPQQAKEAFKILMGLK